MYFGSLMYLQFYSKTRSNILFFYTTFEQNKLLTLFDVKGKVSLNQVKISNLYYSSFKVNKYLGKHFLPGKL